MESRKSSFVKQASILAAAGIIARIIGFLYRVPLTNLIGDEGIGLSSWGYNIYMLLLIISSAGLPAAISKMVSERIAVKRYKDAHRVFKVALIVSGIMGFVATCALFLIAHVLFSSTNDYYSIIVLVPTVFIVAIMAVFRGYFQGMKNTVPTALSQIVEQIFNAVFSVFLAYMMLRVSLPLAAAGSNAGTGIGALVGLITLLVIYIILKPKIKYNDLPEAPTSDYKHQSNWGIARELIMTAMPIIIGVAIFSITNIIDMIMVRSRLGVIGTLSESEITALYGQLTGKYIPITTLPVSLAAALAAAIIPSIASSSVLKDTESVKRKINIAMRLTMIILIPSAVGIGVLSDQILLLLFPRFPDGGELLRIGSVSVIFLALSSIVTGMLQGIGKVYVPAIAAFFGALIKIPLNYVLIADPRIMVAGAVISTTICYAVASTINLIVLCKTTKTTPDYMGAFVKPIIASVAMGIACFVLYHGIYFFVPSNSLACITAIIAGAAVYFAVMLLIGGMKQEDVRLLPYGDKLAKFLR
ncbi:MAG: polysaccharide biosynthesis protein [Defluviitaleaceae bacterium]|nr:polysaccharide biosynthesis protein [Defluviitaleaceae bacterium]